MPTATETMPPDSTMRNTLDVMKALSIDLSTLDQHEGGDIRVMGDTFEKEIERLTDNPKVDTSRAMLIGAIALEIRYIAQYDEGDSYDHTVGPDHSLIIKGPIKVPELGDRELEHSTELSLCRLVVFDWFGKIQSKEKRAEMTQRLVVPEAHLQNLSGFTIEGKTLEQTVTLFEEIDYCEPETENTIEELGNTIANRRAFGAGIEILKVLEPGILKAENPSTS